MSNKNPNPKSDIRSFLDKIVINVGVGRLSSQPGFSDKILPQITKDLSAITGQKPQPRQARKSIAGFKVRQGEDIGLRITLRRQKMVDFFERLVRIVLPRVRDFNGISLKSIDEHGALNIGIKEHVVFPEINPDQSQFNFSLGINIVPKARNRSGAIDRYYQLGVPLKKKAS